MVLVLVWSSSGLVLVLCLSWSGLGLRLVLVLCWSWSGLGLRLVVLVWVWFWSWLGFDFQSLAVFGVVRALPAWIQVQGALVPVRVGPADPLLRSRSWSGLGLGLVLNSFSQSLTPSFLDTLLPSEKARDRKQRERDT